MSEHKVNARPIMLVQREKRCLHVPIIDLLRRGAVRAEPSIVERFESLLLKYWLYVPVAVVRFDQFLGPDFLVLCPNFMHVICFRVPVYLLLIKGHPSVDFVEVILQVSKLIRLFTHRFLRTVETFIWLREIDMIVVNGSLNFVLYSSGKVLT